MKQQSWLLSVFPILMLFSNASAGGSGYSANDIVEFFEKQNALQVTRGICVGTDAECAAEEIKDHGSAFDLLINFDKDSAELSEDARGNLIEFSIALRNPKLNSLRFAVDGFTDASGSDQHNLNLSERRAASVVSFLQEVGVNQYMLVARGWGETNFRVPDALDPANRRVETRILKNQ